MVALSSVSHAVKPSSSLLCRMRRPILLRARASEEGLPGRGRLPRTIAAPPRVNRARLSSFGSLVMYCAASRRVTSGFRPQLDRIEKSLIPRHAASVYTSRSVS
jgi:hypothetical protein